MARVRNRRRARRLRAVVWLATAALLAFISLLAAERWWWWRYVLRQARPARVAFFITVSGSKDVIALKKLLPALWHPQNLYLLHVDGKAPQHEVAAIKRTIYQVSGEVQQQQQHTSAAAAAAAPHDSSVTNIRLLDNPVQVSWGRASMLLTALHGLSTALLAPEPWDFWINLSPADMPLLPPEEMQLVLGTLSRRAPTSFLSCTHPNWSHLGLDRRHTYMDDEGLYRKLPRPSLISMIQARDGTVLAPPMPHPMREIVRPFPDLFDVYKGEFWVVLHRSLADYIHDSPDNVARSVSLYLAGSYISDELFWQTVACHPKLPPSFRIINDSLRFIRWPPKARGHPATMDVRLLQDALASGALFARKFDHVTHAGASDELHQILADKSLSSERMAATLRRSSAKRRERLCA